MTFLKQHGWLFIILLALLIAIVLRIVLPWNTIFTPNGVILTGVDGYYYAHLADLISQNNMQIPKVDYYFDFPYGLDYTKLPSSYNGYGFFIALLTWIFTWGHPVKSTLDFITALHPAILGILALIPIFFITKKLTNNWVASLSMLLGSVMPGEYMGRAMLGSADTHCLEIFLFSYAVMFTVLALNDGKMRIPYIVLAGALATAYLLIWQGAIIFLILLALFGAIWLLWTRLKGEPDYENTCVLISILAVTLVGYFASQSVSNSLLTLFAPLVGLLGFLFYTIATQRVRNWVYLTPLGVFMGLGILSVVSIQFVGWTSYPKEFLSFIQQALNLVIWHVDSTTAEELPILITLGTVTPEIPYAYFSITWYVVFIGIGLLFYQWRKTDLNISFLLVWTVLILLPTLAMRRFAYYFAINATIVTAYTLWIMFKFIWEKD